MDHHHMPAPSTVSLNSLPELFCAALREAVLPQQRQLTLAFEQPRDALWLDMAACATALRAWLRAAPSAHVTLITPQATVLMDAWPHMAEVIKWYGHQFTALTPAHEHPAQLQGLVLANTMVIYQRRDAADWHYLALPRNAVAQRMADALLTYGAGASAQSLGTAGLSS
jgi:hypothetical protein